jgi:membrane-associated phospholipid phosphatase
MIGFKVLAMILGENVKKILLLILVLALNSIGYKLVQIIRPEGVLVTTWVDSFIPYISYFVIPYALYPIIVLIPFVLYWKDYQGYKKMALSLATVLIISLLIYSTFQTTMTRADVEPTDIFNWGVWMIYAQDDPLNLFPSLHVSLPTIATLFIYLRNRKLGFSLAPITILIIISTLFIKQHAFVDIIGGLILSFGVFYFFRNKFSSTSR